METVTFTKDKRYHELRFTKGGGPVTISGTFTPGEAAPKGEGRGHRLFGLALADKFPPNGFPRKRKFDEYPPVWLYWELIRRGDVYRLASHGHGNAQVAGREGTLLEGPTVIEGLGDGPVEFEITFDGDLITGNIGGQEIGADEPIDTLLDAEEGDSLVFYAGMIEGGKLSTPIDGVLEYEISAE